MSIAAIALAAAVLAQAAPKSHMVIVTGLGGEPGYRRALQEWATGLAAAGRKLGMPESSITVLQGDTAGTRARVANRANVTEALRALATQSRPGDVILVFLAGHGSHEGAESRLNIPGPDLSAAEIGALLQPLADRRVVVVNASSASGDFVPALSARGRVIITATKTSMERNATQFGRHFTAALAMDGADADKDGRVSVLEAFLYAKRETARAYTADNRLLTEHAMLDDDGDRTGSAAPGAEGADGALARSVFLGEGTTAPGPTDSAGAALVSEKRALEGRIADLRGRKSSMKPAEYESQLEALLVELALKNEALRGRGGRR
jgi:LmbE family N-acetylglucosaminyl deacetylase